MKRILLLITLFWMPTHAADATKQIVTQSNLSITTYSLDGRVILECASPTPGVHGSPVYWQGKIAVCYLVNRQPDSYSQREFTTYGTTDSILVKFVDRNDDGIIDEIHFSEGMKLKLGFKLGADDYLHPFTDHDYAVYQKNESKISKLIEKAGIKP